MIEEPDPNWKPTVEAANHMIEDGLIFHCASCDEPVEPGEAVEVCRVINKVAGLEPFVEAWEAWPNQDYMPEDDSFQLPNGDYVCCQDCFFATMDVEEDVEKDWRN